MEHNAEISENTQQESVPVMKRTIKDSVFTNLFKDKKYLIQLYQALHPDDKQTTEDDIKDITINNVLVDDIYNDLGFSVGNRLLDVYKRQVPLLFIFILLKKKIPGWPCAFHWRILASAFPRKSCRLSLTRLNREQKISLHKMAVPALGVPSPAGWYR